jgi:putative PIN family toxin of toxin-antitoxin system
VRAVLDANILISALLSRSGPPGQILARWLAGEFELVVSPRLLDEVARTLKSPTFRGRLMDDEPPQFVALLEGATRVDDPDTVPARAPDPGDDYLLALAEAERAILVSGDQHLLGLAEEYPILTPRAFLETLETQR